MSSPSPSQASFSPRQRWQIMLNVCLTTLIVLAVAVMANYLSRDFFLRLHWSAQAKTELSPLTKKFLESLTNEVKVTLYYDKADTLYTTIAQLLNQYHLANSHISIYAVDYVKDKGAAQKVHTEYELGKAAKNLIIFDCPGLGRQVIDGNALTWGATELVRGEKEPEFIRRPTEFLGERAFTSALITVTNPKRLNAYFVEDHRGEHRIDDGDQYGYVTLKTVLMQNYINVQTLSLLGTNPVPADCHLLVVAGAQLRFSAMELDKIDQYLSQGGRLLALFNSTQVGKNGLVSPNGLEALLQKWGVEVGDTVILDPQASPSTERTDMIISSFNPAHPVVNPLLGSKEGIWMLQPRKVGKLRTSIQTADAPRVEEIAFTSPESFSITNPRHLQAYPVMVAVENTIRGVTTERGSTRMLVVGDSYFLANGCIENAADRVFAAQAVNWLLDRMQLLQGIGPRAVGQYRIIMTHRQMRTTRWLLLGGMPGAVLLLGGLVWLRRRK